MRQRVAILISTRTPATSLAFGLPSDVTTSERLRFLLLNSEAHTIKAGPNNDRLHALNIVLSSHILVSYG